MPRHSLIGGIANSPPPRPCPPQIPQGAPSPIRAVTRTLDFTSTRHRVAHSNELDFTSAEFGLYQRARLPLEMQSQ